MPAIDFSRTYAQTGEHAAYRPVRRPPRDAKIQVENGRLTLGGERLPLYFATFVESGALCKVDAEMRATIKRTVADGFNGAFLRSPTERKWTESAWNWGVWEYDNTDVSYANRWSMVEDALEQFDKMIEWSLDEGMECVWIDIAGFDEIVLRHPNQRALGSTGGTGMWWSSEYRQMMWDVNSRIMLRPSSITGIRPIDNPRIIWKLHNETGFSDAYLRAGSSSLGGSAYFDNIVEGVVDSTGDNGYWYTELNAKLEAWRLANAPGWTVPAWGRGSTGVADGAVGFPRKSVMWNWATAADRNHLIDFVAAMDFEATVDFLQRMRAERSDVVLCPGTFHYVDPTAMVMLPEALRSNLVCESHHYFNDATGIGVKLGSAITRKSIQDPTWTTVTNGGGWGENQVGVRASYTAFIASECGQYSPNRWRYQRAYYEVILATMHGYDIAEFMQSQQYQSFQYVNDGRYMGGDNGNVGSPTARLATRAVTPVHRHQFLTEHATAYTIRSNPTAIKAYQYAQKQIGIRGQVVNPDYAWDGSENAIWGPKKIFFELDPSYSPTTTFTGIKVTDSTLNAGYFVRNTATEKVYLKRPEGMQLMSPYMCGFIDTLRERAAADAIFVMPMYLSAMTPSDPCYVCFLRSDGPWPLFTGPMKLYIHGSDYALDTVLQGSDYAQHVADALGSHDPPGEAYFMANDQVQVWYAGASSQNWGSGAGTASDVRLMMPEAFTLSLDTSGMGGTDLEIFGVTKDGLPVRLPSSYDSGTKVWSFNYDGTYPEYTLQPAAKRNTMVRARLGT